MPDSCMPPSLVRELLIEYGNIPWRETKDHCVRWCVASYAHKLQAFSGSIAGPSGPAFSSIVSV